MQAPWDELRACTAQGSWKSHQTAPARPCKPHGMKTSPVRPVPNQSGASCCVSNRGLHKQAKPSSNIQALMNPEADNLDRLLPPAACLTLHMSSQRSGRIGSAIWTHRISDLDASDQRSGRIKSAIWTHQIQVWPGQTS
eukprot:359328-Chlamydomonas_euryale.AAC.1